ncbi:hypothetical protein T484DRAFT_1983961 [Baffinella frigidus]|nr:hypothetical protein T484DRAFT_1983961 [Cryptophyta sp. CCMP2293]
MVVRVFLYAAASMVGMNLAYCTSKQQRDPVRTQATAPPAPPCEPKHPDASSARANSCAEHITRLCLCQTHGVGGRAAITARDHPPARPSAVPCHHAGCLCRAQPPGK